MVREASGGEEGGGDTVRAIVRIVNVLSPE